MASALLAAVLALSVARADGRAQTEAVCQSQFSWMSNGLGQSPCLVAAFLVAECQANVEWDIPALLPGTKYNVPGTDNQAFLTECGCSWSVYNLYQACTACQDVTTITSWGPAGWTRQCTSDLLGHTFFPPASKYAFPANTSVPFWATKDPSTWPNRQFNVDEAKALHDEGHADLTSVQEQKSSPNAGAIAGGVVAAIVVIVAIIVGVLFVHRRRHQKLEQRRTSFAQPAQSETSGSRYERSTILGMRTPSPGQPDGTPMPLPSMMSTFAGDMYSEASAAPSSGIYAVNPLILPPNAPASTQARHAYNSSGDSTNTYVPMSVERFSKDRPGMPQHGRNASSSSLTGGYRPPQQGQFNPPPYSAVATHNGSYGTDGHPTSQEAAAELTPPPGARDELSPLQPSSLQVANPRSNRTSDASTMSYPAEKGFRR